ncbi:MAG: 3-isopropylmalate dehydratase small subunit [Cardiobacteriaceae bacterium]|nr:3-isopropylmalate dehydratase small subunit [Cardiobacteriaceae bacterium]
MKAFTIESGVLAPLYRSNIDTDAILPKQYLKLISKTGFGQYLFDDWRYLPDRTPDPAFILNETRYQGAKFLLAGENFGCGSSREHAVWALDEYGFRAVIAPSFGDIFYSNCFKNGVLPARVSAEDAEALYAATQAVETIDIRVDLDAQTIVCGEKSYSFSVDGFRKHALYYGLDDIGQTLQHADEIRAFEAQHQQKFPWLFQ